MTKFLRHYSLLLQLIAAVIVFHWGGVCLNQPSTPIVWLGVGMVVGSIWVMFKVCVKGAVQMSKRWLGVAVIGLLAWNGAACASRVNAGMVGVKVDYAGTYRGVQDLPIRTGWVAYWPGVSTVFEYPTFVQNVVWTRNPAEGSPANEEITFTNADQMSIAVDISLAYHLDAAKIPAFYLKFRNDDLQAFTLGFMHNVARDQFNAIAGRYHMDQIMGDNGQFVTEVRKALQDELGPYGVVIDQFGIIGAPRPPQSVLDSITMKVKAQQIAIQKQNEVAQATADADKEVAKATGYARSRQIEAEADAAYNRKVAESLSPLLIQNWAITKWNGILPTMTTGAVPFINVSK